ATPELVAERGDHPDRRLGKDVLLDPRRPHGRRARVLVRHVSRVHDQPAEIGSADPAVHLAAGVDWNLDAFLAEADSPAEKRNQEVLEADAEIEDVGALEKEG